jgi:hypothetical protein
MYLSLSLISPGRPHKPPAFHGRYMDRIES